MKIDGTVNINTLITAATIIISGSLAYASLDKRISILEQLAAERSVRVEKQLEDLRVQIKELTQAVHSIKKDRS